MKKRMKFALKLIVIVLLLSQPLSTLACTGVYVGSESSTNGSTYFGRSEDLSDNNTKIFGIQKAKDWPKGILYKDADGFQREMPEHTLRYTFVKDCTSHTPPPVDQNGNVVGQAYPEAGQNEYGVSVSATVSTSSNAKVMAVDPAVEGGITEVSLASIILESATSAKNGVDILAKLMDTIGAGAENNSLLIGDQNEVWMFDILTGHQYVAQKFISRGVMIQPNMILLENVDISDSEHIISSKDLIETAKKAGTFVGEGTTIHIAKSYSREYSAGSQTRYWQGLHYIQPKFADTISPKDIKVGSENVSLLRQPDKKLATVDILHILGYRGEDSDYDSNKNPGIYPIGNAKQMEVHFMEIRKGLPSQLATLQWQGIGDGELNIYVPYYTALIQDVNEKYKYDVAEKFNRGISGTDGESSINGLFNRINHLNNRNRSANMAPVVQKYFHQFQQALIDKQKEIDSWILPIFQANPNLASEKATNLGIQLSDITYQVALDVYRKMSVYVTAGDYSNPLQLKEFQNPLNDIVLEKEVPPCISDENQNTLDLSSKENTDSNISGPKDTSPSNSGSVFSPSEKEPYTVNTNENTTQKSSKQQAAQKKNEPSVHSSQPQTGDDFHILPWMLLDILSFLGVFLFSISKKVFIRK